MLTADAGHREQGQIPFYLQASLFPLNSDRSPSCEVILGLDATTVQEKCGTESNAQASFKSWLVNPAVAASHTKRMVSTKVFCFLLAPGSYEEEMLSVFSRNHTLSPQHSMPPPFQAAEFPSWLKPSCPA